MKYKLTNTLQATFPRGLTKGFTVLQTYQNIDNEKSSILYVNDKRFKETIKIQNPNFNGGGLLQNKLYYIEGQGVAYEIDLKTNQHKLFLEDEFIGLEGFVDNKIIINNHSEKTKSQRTIIGNDFMAMVDTESHETVWTTKKLFRANFLYNEVNLYVKDFNGSLLRCISKETGEDIWQFSIKELGRYEPQDESDRFKDGVINRLIAIYQNLLLVQISSFRVIALDTQTGKLIWMIDDFRKFLPEKIYSEIRWDTNEDIKRGQSSNWHIIPEINKMYLCWFMFVFEVDLITQECVIIHNNYPVGVPFGQSERVENLIYFIGNNQNYFGIFDITARKIIWSFIHPQKVLFSGLWVNEDKIYLRDWNESLLILEKEE